MMVNVLSAPAGAEVFTMPGASVTTTKPSSLSMIANLVAAMTAAAFVIPYAAILAVPRAWTALTSPAPEPMTMIFLVFDARRRGRKAVILWTGPRLLTLNYTMEGGVSFGRPQCTGRRTAAMNSLSSSSMLALIKQHKLTNHSRTRLHTNR